MSDIDLLIITEIISPYRIPVFNILSRLLGKRFHVVFLSETDSRRQWKVYTDKIEFSYQVLSGTKFQIKQGHPYFLNFGIGRVIKELKPKALIIGGYAHPSFPLALLSDKSLGVPCALWCESNNNDQRLGWSLVETYKRWFIQQCDAYVVPGTASENYLTNYGVNSEQIFHAPNAIDSPYFSANYKHQSVALQAQHNWPRNLVLYVGRITQQKGILDLINAFAQLNTTNTGLLIVGDGPERPAAEQLCKTLACQNVFFAGFVHQEELPGYYGSSKIFVLPTYSDPWGLVLNEAMSCQCAVIASEVAGATADLVEHNQTGCVFPAGDVSKLKFYLEQLLSAPEDTVQMGKKGYEKIQQYSPQSCAEGFVQLTEQLLNNVQSYQQVTTS
ncbi:MAG: glycosyltransferase family 4 protein [Cyanobacteria bacterium J06576_12]